VPRFGEPELRVDDLGEGWDQPVAALVAVQADLSRTVHDAPRLVLLWSDELSDEPESDGRRAYVGKSLSWYFGASGGFELPREYGSAVLEIVDQLQDAIVDSLLGMRTFWPICPAHGKPLRADHRDGTAVWICGSADEHVLAEVGQLRY
jgi:hypothetical protein